MTSLSNVDAPNPGDLAADLKEASCHRRHNGAACPDPGENHEPDEIKKRP